jgi:hypothetical protein
VSPRRSKSSRDHKSVVNDAALHERLTSLDANEIERDSGNGVDGQGSLIRRGTGVISLRFSA